jgi:hypothetical protein
MNEHRVASLDSFLQCMEAEAQVVGTVRESALKHGQARLVIPHHGHRGDRLGVQVADLASDILAPQDVFLGLRRSNQLVMHTSGRVENESSRASSGRVAHSRVEASGVEWRRVASRTVAQRKTSGVKGRV